MNFYMRFYWIKLLKFFFISHAICSLNWLENIYEKKTLQSTYTRMMKYYELISVTILIYHLHAILSPSLSSRLHAMSWAICRIYFSFFLSLSTTQTMKMFRIFIAAQIDIYFCNIYYIWDRVQQQQKSLISHWRCESSSSSSIVMLMDEMECQWLNLLISEQFVIFFLYVSHFRWISSAKCAVNLPRAFISAHLPVKDARWERLMNFMIKCSIFFHLKKASQYRSWRNLQ